MLVSCLLPDLCKRTKKLSFHFSGKLPVFKMKLSNFSRGFNIMNPPYFNISFEIISGDVLFPLLRDLIAALISCVVISLSKMLSNVSFPSFSFNNWNCSIINSWNLLFLSSALFNFLKNWKKLSWGMSWTESWFVCSFSSLFNRKSLVSSNCYYSYHYKCFVYTFVLHVYKVF